MKKILVTGGSGFIGSHLVGRLLNRGDEVYCIDDGTTGRLEKIKEYLSSKHFHFVKGTILDEIKMKKLVKLCDEIYHFAAVVGVLYYVENPEKVLRVNIKGTRLVLDLALKYKKKVYFSSTSEVYGKNPKVPWKEDDDRILGSTSINRWCYSTSKAASEHLCFAYYKLGMPMVIFRFFNVYGPRLDSLGSGRVIAIMAEQALKNNPITIIGDGMQTRCFTYITDALDGIMSASETDTAIGNVFNIGIDKETTIASLALRIKKIYNSKSELVFVDKKSVYGESYEDLQRRVPDITKARQMLMFNPTITLDQGLPETLAWFKTQFEKKK